MSSVFRTRRGSEFGHAEVENLDQPVAGNHDVFRFQVAMHDAGGMGFRQSIRYLCGNVNHFGQRNGAGSQQLAHRFSFHQFHGDVGGSIYLPEFVNGHDIGMVQGRCRARFLLEAFDAPAVGVQVARQYLDGDLTPKAGIARAIDFSHPAGAERGQNLVGAKSRARRSVAGSPRGARAHLADLSFFRFHPGAYVPFGALLYRRFSGQPISRSRQRHLLFKRITKLGELMDLRSVQQPLKEQYRREPGSSRITLKAKGSETATPMGCSVDLGRALYQAEAHTGVGGTGTAACSGDLLLGALAACAQITCQMVAAAMGIPTEHIEVTVEGTWIFPEPSACRRTRWSALNTSASALISALPRPSPSN